MESKNKWLIKISFLTGIVPLVGGWGIFLAWLLGRYLNASDFRNLEPIGFLWMLVSFFVALIGVFLWLVYVIINRREFHKKMLIVLFVILINIPSVLIVLSWQKYVSGVQFIKVVNQSKVEILHIEIIREDSILASSKILNDDIEVLHFNLYSDFKIFEPRKHERGIIKMVLTNSQKRREISINELSYGRCKQIEIGDDLVIINKSDKI